MIADKPAEYVLEVEGGHIMGTLVIPIENLIDRCCNLGLDGSGATSIRKGFGVRKSSPRLPWIPKLCQRMAQGSDVASGHALFDLLEYPTVLGVSSFDFGWKKTPGRVPGAGMQSPGGICCNVICGHQVGRRKGHSHRKYFAFGWCGECGEVVLGLFSDLAIEINPWRKLEQDLFESLLESRDDLWAQTMTFSDGLGCPTEKAPITLDELALPFTGRDQLPGVHRPEWIEGEGSEAWRAKRDPFCDTGCNAKGTQAS